MNGTQAGPKCPRCRRKLAAWRLDHCIYCGEKFPENIREGFTEPEALKFVERPAVTPEVAKQLEMLKVVSIGEKPKAKTPLVVVFALLTLPVFAGIFYMLYRLVSRTFPSAAILIVAAALLFLGYVGWTVAKSARS
jgi:hypothetical protein